MSGARFGRPRATSPASRSGRSRATGTCKLRPGCRSSSGSNRSPVWAATDRVARGERDPAARAILITWSRPFAERVSRAVAAQAAGRDIVKQSLAARGAIIVVGAADEAMALANRIAPEHLVVDRES